MSVLMLLEKFLTAEKFSSENFNGYAEIYVNPTSSEMKEIATHEDNDESGIRLATDDAGNVFAWNYLLLHDQMEYYLKKKWALRFEYTYSDSTLYTASHTTPKEWKRYFNDKMLAKLKRAIPNMDKIEMSTQPFEVLWEE